MTQVVQIMLLCWNILLIPGIVYIVKLEKRLAKIEVILLVLCKDKNIVLET